MDGHDRIRLRVDAGDPLTAMGATEALRPFADLVVSTEDGTAVDVVVLIADVVDGPAVARIREAHTGAEMPVVLVATMLDESSAMAAVGAGARAILRRRDARPERLVDLVRSFVRGEGTVPVEVLSRLLEHLVDAAPDGSGVRVGRLTEREAEVLRLVSEGLETAEIADRLHFSQRTIKGIIHDFTMRHHLRNRAHAVAYAMRHGLI
ncbi:MAG: LuxR C-terminal-related transcriptional regulator [Ornithinimicrobium sp.]